MQIYLCAGCEIKVQHEEISSIRTKFTIWTQAAVLPCVGRFLYESHENYFHYMAGTI